MTEIPEQAAPAGSEPARVNQPIGSAAPRVVRSGPRRRHLPVHFVWRGDEYDYSRVEDGGSLACLDRYTEQEQKWTLLSGWVIFPTGAEVRDIIFQVHGIGLPEAPAQKTTPQPEPAAKPPEPNTEELDALRARIAELEAREPEVRVVEKIVEKIVEIPVQNEPPPPAPLKEEEGEDEPDSDTPIDVNSLVDLMAGNDAAAEAAIADMRAERRRRFTELLNVEKAELRNARGSDKENLPREAQIDKLLGLFARVGEKT